MAQPLAPTGTDPSTTGVAPGRNVSQVFIRFERGAALAIALAALCGCAQGTTASGPDSAAPDASSPDPSPLSPPADASYPDPSSPDRDASYGDPGPVSPTPDASYPTPGPATPPLGPSSGDRTLFRAVDLNVGERAEVALVNGSRAQLELLELEEIKDDLRSAVRQGKVTIRVNGASVTLTCTTYHLPVTVAGVQIDCPITKGYRDRARQAPWALDKDARLRLWPLGSPWIPSDKFVYPIKQRWFASDSQMANEPAHVDGGERPGSGDIYYHFDLDIGGAEGLVEVVSAADGQVSSNSGANVFIRSDDGWRFNYLHLNVVDPQIQRGARVRMGQRIGMVGKESSSGGWSHLHFGISRAQPSGRNGTEDAYAFIWEAYLREYKPKILAVARPHHFAWTGAEVTLDGSRSWSAAGPIARYEWTFDDGSTAEGPRAKRTYDRAGHYSEVLKVTDANGNVDYDFAVINVADRANPGALAPTINASYYPTSGIQPGMPVTFKVRTFRTSDGEETWNFGDGTPTVTTKSGGDGTAHAPDGYAEVKHTFANAGHYVVRIERANGAGLRAATHLQVRAGMD